MTNWQAAGNVNGLANGFSLCLCGLLVENVGLGLLICNLLQISFEIYGAVKVRIITIL